VVVLNDDLHAHAYVFEIIWRHPRAVRRMGRFGGIQTARRRCLGEEFRPMMPRRRTNGPKLTRRDLIEIGYSTALGAGIAGITGGLGAGRRAIARP